MTEHKYRMTFKKIARKSLAIWLTLIAIIPFIIYIRAINVEQFYGNLLMPFFGLLIIFFPGLFLHIDYILNGLNKVVLIKNESIIISNKRKTIEIKINEIKEIVKVESFTWTHFSWWSHYYYRIESINGQKIKLCCYFFSKDNDLMSSTDLKKMNKDLIIKQLWVPFTIKYAL